MNYERTQTKSAVAATPSWVGLFALQDLLLLGYLFVVWALVRRAGAPAYQAERYVLASAALVGFGAFFGRAATEVSPRIRGAVYRVALTGAVLLDYLMLRVVLPLVRPDSVDAGLLRADRAIFGVEPALWLERWNTLPLVEYCAFFYYSYFGLCASYLLVAVFWSRPARATAEFALGTVLVYCVGQLGYMAVPAYGPVTALAGDFSGPLHGGFFWACVCRAVAAGGAMKDVFPSLHTAGPVWFALHAAARAKDDRRYRPVAWVTAFFAANIIFSTMFLRWHYAVDVVAGLALALGASVLARRLAGWEDDRRRRAGVEGVWTFS
jgi:hypothetical protein